MDGYRLQRHGLTVSERAKWGITRRGIHSTGQALPDESELPRGLREANGGGSEKGAGKRVCRPIQVLAAEPTPSTDERELQTTDLDTKQPTTLNDWDYEAGDITTDDGEKHTKLHVMRWQFGSQPVNHGVLLNVGGKVPTYSGWSKVFADKPSHEGGHLMARGQKFKAEEIIAKLRKAEVALPLTPNIKNSCDMRQ